MGRKRLINPWRVKKLRRRIRFPDKKLPNISSSSDSDNKRSSSISINSSLPSSSSTSECDSTIESEIGFGDSDVSSFITCAERQDNSRQDLAQNQEMNDKIYLIIAKIFKECNLHAEAAKKVYKLMEFISVHKIPLINYKSFVAIKTATISIKYSTLIYCKTHAALESIKTCDCTQDLGYLVIFNYVDTIKLIVSRNYIALSSGFRTEIMSSKSYHELWSDLETDNNQIRLSLIANLDDAQMMRSSRTCCTPISCVIAELSRGKRISKNNLFNIGIYWGSSGIKPDILFSKCIEDVFNIDFQVQDSRCGTEHRLKESRQVLNIYNKDLVIISRFLAITCDSVAKAKILNIKMFNGRFGCPYCLHPGKSVVDVRTGTKKLVYSYENDYSLKTCQFYKDAWLRSCHDDNGVKGTTKISKFIMVSCNIPIDYMHAILEGVFKFLMTMKPFSTASVRSYVDGKVKDVLLPHDTNRKFRKLSEIAYWKSSEAKTFLIHLTPLLKNVISTDCFVILLALVAITRSLCSDSKTESELEEVSFLISKISLAIQEIYGEHNMRFNLHLLLHLVDQYKKFGSLVDVSCFSFENNIYNLKRSFHGTRGQLNQMRDSYIFKMCNYDNDINEFYEKYSDNTRQGTSLKKALKSADSNYSIDKNLLQRLKVFYPSITEEDLEIFHVFSSDSQTFHSCNYKYRRGSNSFFASFRRQDLSITYGKIVCFIAIKSRIVSNDYLRKFAFMQIYPKVGRINILSGLDQPLTSAVRQMMRVNILKNQHFIVTSSRVEELVDVDKLIARAIILQDENHVNRFSISDVNIPIEHD